MMDVKDAPVEEQINSAFAEVKELLEQRRDALLKHIDYLEANLDPDSVVLFSEGNLDNFMYALNQFGTLVDASPDSDNIKTERVLARVERKPFELRIGIYTKAKNPFDSSIDFVYDFRVDAYDKDAEDKEPEVMHHEQVVNRPYLSIPLKDYIGKYNSKKLKVYGKTGFREGDDIVWGNECAPYELALSSPWQWVPIENAQINGNEVLGGETKILINPPMSAGVNVLEVVTLRNGNMGIGFSDHNHPQGPLAASWVGGGNSSYSIWSHGTQCGGDANVRFVPLANYQNGRCNYTNPDQRVRMIADMGARTVTYVINDLEAGRFENIPAEISFVAYIGGGGFRIIN